MSKTRDSLLNYIKNLDQQITDICSLKKQALDEIKQIENQERLDRFNKAMISSPVDWKEVLRTNELGELLPEQIEYIKEYISPVNKILELDGFFHETKQAGFVLKLINYKYNQKAVDKLYGYLLDIVEGIELIRVHHSIEKRFKVLPILDKRKGEKGSYSILIDEENNSYVYREYRTRPEMVLSDVPLDEAIKYASKKFYFYG